MEENENVLDALVSEYDEVEVSLANPETLSNQRVARNLGKRFAELKPIVATHRQIRALTNDLLTARELSGEDSSFLKEAESIETKLEDLNLELLRLLVPRDPDDAKNVIMEIKPGSGGDESGLFATDLVRMYSLFAASKGWKFLVLSKTETGLGGIKDIEIAIRGKNVTDSSDGVWHDLKYEGGVHRVQRVPVTESQGRIHTSAAGVYVYPEIDDDDDEIEIDTNDIRVDVFRSSGPGGQSVNTTDSAVRITHIPTGIVVSMQNEKSQIQNREAALRILKARLYAKKQEEAAAEAADLRHSQVRTLDRSERIRTYNYPENRITDHRSGYKAYNLDQVMNGALEPIIQSLIKTDEDAKLGKS
ncbi:MAG: peptide chain release factor 1 [Bifidobacteriaceae bacterium]|jgi:peptide chain release factor 1|nr:peptide chain release factor 1 [Bifidobacteriaceae bacterium]